MSVRNALLAILTIGPAYGFQLHGELASRTAGRRSVNAGQIYGTLDRLIRQDVVESAGATPDGLPLYRLTRSGRAEALDWLHRTDSSPGEEWSDLLDRVLIASSLPEVDAMTVVAAYREYWEAVGARNPPSVSGQDRLAAQAGLSLANAALAWLDEVETHIVSDDEGALSRVFDTDKPRRGRPPAVPVG
ncbi:MAG TPA: PadR family transcriptional regulator [Glaciibacter sp.]|nr:PadR family transcriptional regulator [Glaciibacter sp.]